MNDPSRIVELLCVLQKDVSLDYFFGNLLKYFQMQDWSYEEDLFLGLLDSWTPFKQAEDMIALYRHSLQSIHLTS